MAKYNLGIGQNEAKEVFVGNPEVNRYGVFNGLQRPRVIDAKHALDDAGQLHMLGFDAPSSAPIATALLNIGELNAVSPWSGFYSYRTVALSARYLRPVPVGDDTDAYTRSNPSPVSSAVFLNPMQHACSVTQDYYARDDVTHIGWYRSLIKSTSNEASAGNWYLTQVTTNSSGSWNGRQCLIDVTPDWELGRYAVETDNWPPPTCPWAAEVDNTFFCGGNRAIGEGLTVAVHNGSWGVELETADEKFHDGIRGWIFTKLTETEGGIDGIGHYYVRRLTDTILQLQDVNGDPYPYEGDTETGVEFVAFADGYGLRYSKPGEPESWPLNNLVRMRGEITGMAPLPNETQLIVCSDRPDMSKFDLSVLGTVAFKQPLTISDEFSAYHFTMHSVEGYLRGLDSWRGCIWESDGSSVRDVTRGILKDIWRLLSKQTNKQKNWHSAYDPHQKLYAAFVTLANSARVVDFAICQHIRTGAWFYWWPKDLLCSCDYRDPNTGVQMVFAGTEGLGTSGGTWGRIFAPGHYNEWVYSNTLLSGTITAATATVVTVDNTDDDLCEVGDGLAGRWVLITNGEGGREQIACISANTANTFTVNRVYGGGNATQLDPVPEADWLFFIGMIECRWGPKRFTFQDPSITKQVLEVNSRIQNVDVNNRPFVRLYRSEETSDTQDTLSARDYITKGDSSEMWVSRHKPIEKVFEFGMTLYDRSYAGIEIQDLTIAFEPQEE